MANHNPYELERVSIRLVRDAVTPMISDTPLNNPEAVVKLLHDEIFADLDREIFAVVNLKTSMEFDSMKVLMDEKPPTKSDFGNLVPSSINICSMGTLSESIVHPREVLKSSILSNANAVLLIHNHPSGSLQPSREDIVVTDRLMQAYNLMGIEVLDHIIMGPHQLYYSFQEQDTLPIPENRCTTTLKELSFDSQNIAGPANGLAHPATSLAAPASSEEIRESALEKLKDTKEASKSQMKDPSKTKRTNKKKIQEESL